MSRATPRDRVRDDIRGVLERSRNGEPGALVVLGEPGIGKSTLLSQECRDLDGAFVLWAAGAEHEMDLPLATLNQLLHPVRDAFALMDDRHRKVLVAAIEYGEPATPMVLGLAVLDLLGALGEQHALTVVVLDDVQWIDEFSESVLAFAIRRLNGERVATLLAARTGEMSAFGDVRSVELDGVDDDVARSLLSAGGAVTAEVARLARIACGGNPFALRQLGASLSARQLRGVDPLPVVVPMGPSLAAVLERRIEGLSESARSALIMLAAAGSGDRRSVIDAWHALGLSSADLVEAERADLIAQATDGYEFTHPLMRSAVLNAAQPWRLRAAHRALAESLARSSFERRAHHLDLAADGPDDEAAEALEIVASHAARQGAQEVAAAAWERAARRSTSELQRARRLGEAGYASWRAQRPQHGMALSREALDALTDGSDRAAVVLPLGDMVAFFVDTREGVQMLVDEASRTSEELPALAANMMSQAANLCALGGDLRRAVALCTHAQTIAQRADAITQIGCRAIFTHLRLVHGEARDLASDLTELESLGRLIGSDSPEQLVTLGQLIVFDLMALGRWDAADDLATRVIAQARSVGLRGVESFVHGLRGEVAWRRGRWIEARGEALFEVHVSEDRGDGWGSFAHATLARVEAAMGLVEASTANAEVVIAQGAAVGMGVMEAWGRHARGLAALAAGDAAAAVVDLEWIWELCQQGEIGEPGPLWWHGDLVEALWRVDRVTDARRFAQYLNQRAEETGSEWASAIGARADGLLRRDVERLRYSADCLDTIGAPFEAARSRALVGEIGSPGAFLSDVDAAYDAFCALGARPWAERTAAMVGGRESVTTSPLDVLTKAELRVAAAVSRGLSNRDAADSLFLSPKTIDAHLQRIYRKLDVTSRTELAVLISGTRLPSTTR